MPTFASSVLFEFYRYGDKTVESAEKGDYFVKIYYNDKPMKVNSICDENFRC